MTPFDLLVRGTLILPDGRLPGGWIAVRGGTIAAIGLGQRFGVVAILDRSIPRHLRHLRQLGLIDRLAGDRALGIGVAGLSGAGVVDRIAEVGRRLIEEDGADVLILGCAGMGRHRPAIEDRLGVPVVDPAQAAVARALSLLDLGYRRTV